MPKFGLKLTRKCGHRLIALTLALIIGIANPAVALGSTLDEVRYLLETQYVKTLDSSVLNASSVEEILKKVGDPHTDFFTRSEFQEFLDSMNMSFSGIGVYIQQEPRGLEITSVIKGSPAEEAKLQAGDIIIEADGRSLAGLSQEVATGLVRGPEGTTVNIVVLRGEERLKFKVTRRNIEVPTVTGEMLDKSIGYVAIESFGTDTKETFQQVVKDLYKKGAKAWIIDLRNNTGGYLDTALELAGFFIGEQTALITKDRSQKATEYKGVKQDLLITEPTIFLTNGYSASASEILTAVVKDYKKAVVVGTKTYGKGSVQTLYQLSEGDYLKLTVAEFYSPLGKAINGVGVSPDVTIKDNDPVAMAQLMLENYTQKAGAAKNSQYLNFSAGGKDWSIDLKEATTPENWFTFKELLQKNSFRFTWWDGSQVKTFTADEQKALWPFFYPGYKGMAELNNLPLDKTFTVRFTAPIVWNSVTGETIELIARDTGERIPVKLEQIDERTVKVIPEVSLEPQTSYWLVIHQGIKGQDGSTLQQGALTVVSTGK